MTTYLFLQHYWWLLISVLGALLVLMMFVQGANTLLFKLSATEEERRLILGTTGRKWELTFTTLVTFGGAFFAAFPMFYSVSFGGAYWAWMLLLFSFVLQAVSYEFEGKVGNVLGRQTFRYFLVFNGFVGPFLVGVVVSTFFTGSAFFVEKAAMGNMGGVTNVCGWSNAWHGLDALFNLWNVVLGFAVFFLARVLGALYMRHNLSDQETLVPRLRREVLADGVPFLVTFVGWLVHLLLMKGYHVAADGSVVLMPYKYFYNLIEMPWVAVILLVGVVLVLYGMGRTLLSPTWRCGIWWTGLGAPIAVVALFLLAGYHQTPYYPSLVDPQCSLTLSNSCSSEFTLTVMAWVSLLVPVVLAYVWYCWRSIEKKAKG